MTHMDKPGKKPLISVITVVFNGEEYLEQAIKSVIDQADIHIEYIIIDGGSSDGTLGIINKYENHIDSWTSEPDKGIFDAMNKGIKKATGEFIGMLNADDWYESGILEKIKDKITGFQESFEDRVIYCDHYWYDEELSPGTKIKRKSEMKYWKGMTISHQAMFVHRSVYEKLGSYNLEYRFASDYEFFLRMIKAGVVFEKIDVYGINFRKGGISTKYMNQSITEVSRIVRKYFGTVSKEYMLFLLTNRLPSLLGNIRLILTKIIGKDKTNRLRRLRRQLTGKKSKETGK
jgi:glycosyltransferase involved in cell wall biosynthesis